MNLSRYLAQEEPGVPGKDSIDVLSVWDEDSTDMLSVWDEGIT